VFLVDRTLVLDFAYEVTVDQIREIPETTFSAAGLRERDDLQRLLRSQFRVISPDTKIIAEFVWRMEDVIQTYLLPYDPKWPVVCFDEASKQIFGEVRPRQPTRRGRSAVVDYEFERKGVCCQLMMCEALRGWRDVIVTDRRTRQDYAHCIRDLVDR
jgi:hypothetical protein